MGHIRLGAIPKSRPWTAVVASLGVPAASSVLSTSDAAAKTDAFVGQVAKRTLAAARAGLTKAKKDDGLRQTFYLLAQVALASRGASWLERLRLLGIELSDESTILDLTTEVQAAVDGFLQR